MNIYVKSCRSIKAQHIPAASSVFSASARRSVAAAPLLVLCALFLFFGCTRARTSSLMLAVGAEDRRARSQSGGTAQDKVGISSAPAFLPLVALNANARGAFIGEGAKSPYMFFAFTEDAGTNEKPLSFVRTGGALELELNVHAEPAVQHAADGALCFAAFLYVDDFSSLHSLKKNLVSRPDVKVFIKKEAHFKISIGFEGGTSAPSCESIKGFMIYSAVPVELKSAAVTKAYCGWAKDGTVPRFGFSASGGTVDSSLLNEGKVPEQTFFSQVPLLLQDGARAVRIMLRMQSETGSSAPAAASASSVPDVRIACGSDKLRIRRSPAVRSVSIDERTLSSVCDSVKILSGADSVEGVLLEYGFPDAFTPITADAGLVTVWPHKEWRRKDFELFSWEQFPSVLIFDFADYAVQNAFLKRIAFFVEKKGFIGTLLTDAQMASSHGFNAHDYRAESLAAFFDKAEKDRFALNESELLLRDILFANGVIVRSASGIKAGRGAVLSISRESPRFLRDRLLAHEGLHGVYFTEASFRREVDEVFYSMDPVSLRFLKRYFEVNPSLNYNTDDSYLFKNEFMAYTLQQSVGEVKNYYINTLARIINSAEPELCAYIRDTEAAAFTQAAERMSSFLAENWGISGGRISLVSFD